MENVQIPLFIYLTRHVFFNICSYILYLRSVTITFHFY